MKRTNVYLDEEQARLLRHLAVDENRSFTDIVREALNDYLDRRGLQSRSRVIGPKRALPDMGWRDQFEAVLARIRSGAPEGIAPEEIERAITAARAEVREARNARRRAANG